MTASNERITTPFNAESTAAEVVAGIDLNGQRVIVTGGASGIGIETARALAGAGAEVTLAVRDLAAGQRIAADITATTSNRHVLVAPLDLADKASVASFVAGWEGPLHILVNNAGVMACPLMRTPRAGRCSSPPITSATSPWLRGCTMLWPGPAGRASSRSARPGI